MAILRCPGYMAPVARLATMPVRMTADLEPKLEKDDEKKDDGKKKDSDSESKKERKQKTNAHFPGCKAWSARVECVVGTQTIDLPNGETGTGLEMEPYTVTIWATPDEESAVLATGRAGAWVRLEGLMAGSYKGLYLQATGLKPTAKEEVK